MQFGDLILKNGVLFRTQYNWDKQKYVIYIMCTLLTLFRQHIKVSFVRTATYKNSNWRQHFKGQICKAAETI